MVRIWPLFGSIDSLPPLIDTPPRIMWYIFVRVLSALFLDGVKLNEGFVADEDTTIYNPGLTLLTSSEKERLVNAIVDNRQIGLSTQHWSENNEYAFDFLKQKLDRK